MGDLPKRHQYPLLFTRPAKEKGGSFWGSALLLHEMTSVMRNLDDPYQYTRKKNESATVALFGSMVLLLAFCSVKSLGPVSGPNLKLPPT